MSDKTCNSIPGCLKEKEGGIRKKISVNMKNKKK